MKSLRFVLCMGLIVALSGSAFAVLDRNCPRLTSIGENLRFSANFAGMEIDLTGIELRDVAGTLTGMTLTGSGYAIGYIPAALDPAGAGLGSFVLYTNIAGTPTVIADVRQDGTNSAGVAHLGTTLGLGVASTAYGLGTVDNIQNPDGVPVAFPQTRPGGPGDTQQITFVFSGFQAQINSPTPASFESVLQFDPVTGLLLGTGTLSTQFVANNGTISIYEDASTDASSMPGNIPTPNGELPTRFHHASAGGNVDADGNFNEYYDPAGGALSPFRFGDDSDVDESLFLLLAYTDGMRLEEVFTSDLRGPAHADTIGGPDVFHPSYAAVTLMSPNGTTYVDDGFVTMYSGGSSDFGDNGPCLFPIGGECFPLPICPEFGFRITSDVNFGLTETSGTTFDDGVLPEDGNYFQFQTPKGGGPEIYGGLVCIPEPLTMIGLLLGGSSLAGYLRKRRS